MTSPSLPPPAEAPLKPPSRVEAAKSASGYLRGTLIEELAGSSSALGADAEQLIKHHGIYQQDNRDLRRSGERQHSFFVRTRLPGGCLTAAQLLTELDLCDELGDGTLRITDRQGLQLHGIVKHDLQTTIRRIAAAKLTSFGACGDVVRNVMCCPAPVRGSATREWMHRLTGDLASHFALRSRAYYDVWLDSGDGEQRRIVSGGTADEEPVYGPSYLPRKFKFAFALPDDNCVDALTHDVGFVALPGREGNPQFNMYVGGGMGMTPARADTFPAVARPFCRVSAAELLPVADAVVRVQRDFGYRADRKRARLKYLIADWRLDRFRDEVCHVYGRPLDPPEEIPITGAHDHLGWHPQEEDRWFLGVPIACGRIQDGVDVRTKSALRALLGRHPYAVRLTPMQSLLVCGVREGERSDVERILDDHSVPLALQLAPIRRRAIACPALPTCGLAITESERSFPGVLDELERLQAEFGLSDQSIVTRMTGCPNGCARPYVAEIGIVGKAVGRYTLYLGGSAAGTRLAVKAAEMLTLPEVFSQLRGLLAEYAQGRQSAESFGDFYDRVKRASE